MVVWAANANLEYGFSLEWGAGLGVGVACGYSTGEDEQKGKGEELTEASVEEDVVCGEYALYFRDVVVLNAPVSWDLFSASDVQEGLRASLRVVVYIDMIDMGGGMIAAMRKAWCWHVVASGRFSGEILMRYGMRRRARRLEGLWERSKW